MTNPATFNTKLRPELLNELLNGPLSSRIAYLGADLCPCRAERGSGNPDPRCKVCGGLGYTWADHTPSFLKDYTLTRAPLPGFEDKERLGDPRSAVLSIVDENGVTYPPESVSVRPDGTLSWRGVAPAQFTLYTVSTEAATLRAGVQGVMSRREYQVRGEYDVLDLEMTIDRHMNSSEDLNPAWDCGEFDRFVLLDFWRRHAQHVKRGPGGDLTIYRRMRALQLSSVQNDARVVWQEGTDWAFADGAVTWLPGRGPALGTWYAVQGQTNPEYYVFKALPQTRHQDGKELPRRIVLKAFEHFPNKRPAVSV